MFELEAACVKLIIKAWKPSMRGNEGKIRGGYVSNVFPSSPAGEAASSGDI